MALPARDAAPAGAVLLDGRDDALCRLGVAEGDEHLIEHDVVEYLVACRAEPLGETGGVAAGALDEIGYPAAAKGAQGCLDFDASRATR